MSPSILSTLRPKTQGTVTTRYRHPTRRIYAEVHRPTRHGEWPVLAVVWSNHIGIHSHLLKATSKAGADQLARRIAGQATRATHAAEATEQD